MTKNVTVGFRTARRTPLLSQEQRLDWLRILVEQPVDTLSYRVAGMLLLLYAQPLVRIVRLEAEAATESAEGLFIKLGEGLAPVPEPFAAMLRAHLSNRPNLRTASGGRSPWLSPSTRPGRHLDAQSLMERLQGIGIELQAARNTALRELVRDVPAPIAARMLGYSDQVTHKHAAAAAVPWGAYADAVREQAKSTDGD
ncbi:hypothetical protein [Actinoallomurus sp. NPDC052274]|uniref:hypothetical protein n=1 Tax=Actinoallomurus sp. NPDC052274 TaxID=3155420 RepID=UPI003417A6F5